MKNKIIDYSKRTVVVVGSIAVIFSVFLTLSIFLALNSQMPELDLSNEPISNTSFNENSNVTQDISNDIVVNTEVSEIYEDELQHGWIINEYGYTYVYGDSGFLQFNYKKTSLERYVDSMNRFSESVPQQSELYNIIVPVSTTFADIPKDVYKEDNFFNLSQSSFVATVASKFNDNIKNISIVNELETAFDEGENVYFRTDSNWTSLGAFLAYETFCEAKGFAPLPLEVFEKRELGDFLGSFYQSTGSRTMLNNPDQFVCYGLSADISTVMTVYDGDAVFTDYTLCNNKVSERNKYNVFLGKEAGRYSISTNGKGGSILIIGDSSVHPILPFLAAHYKEIEYINPLKHKKDVSELLDKYQFDDIVTMCYSTNAVLGDYIPSFSILSGVNENE